MYSDKKIPHVNSKQTINKSNVKLIKSVKPEKPEKMALGYRPKVIEEDRKSRGKVQKIYLVMTHEYSGDILERSYEVMGTTGNVYNVCIKTSPTCTCPDYTTRYKRCKHIYFVLSRIMKVKSDQEDIEEYTDDDLLDMFENIPQITENLRIDAHKMDKFKTLIKNGNGEVVMRDICEEDVCPICLDYIFDCNEEITYCKYSCGNVIHKECFDKYTDHRNETAKCLYCHKKWEKEDSKSNYFNLLN